MPPFFTIITSTYNAADTLPRLLDSLASQTCRDFNWIVQDGASSDATMQIVEQYRDRLPEILADSSKDNGIYDAWNKAIDRWQDKMGEWVLFLGADDTLFAHDTLATVKEKIEHLNEYIIFAAGDAILIDDSENIIYKNIIKDGEKAFNQRTFIMKICHSSLFTRKNIILKHKFDPSFTIVGDHYFLIKTWKHYDQLEVMHLMVTKMGFGGISSNPAYKKLFAKEELKIALKTKSFRGLILYIASNLHPYKIKIKKQLFRTKLGINIWGFLKNVCSNIFSSKTR